MNKKIILLFAAACCMGNAKAIECYFTSADIAAEVGGSATIEVVLHVDEPIRDIQMFLNLPEGITLAKDSENYYLAAVQGRAQRHALGVNFVENQYRFTISSTSGYTMSAGVGVILTIPLDLNIDAGSYEFSFDTVYCSNPNKITCDNFGGTITVTAPEIARYGDNQLYAKDITINQGENASLQVAYNSLSDVHGYSTEITLPTGVNIGAISYTEVLTSQNYTTEDSFANGVLTLSGEQSGTAKKPKPAEAGNQVFANVELLTADLAPGVYDIVVGKQYLSNEDDENDGEFNPAAYTAKLTVATPQTSFDLVDGEAYVNTTDRTGVDVTYTRQFKNTEWQSLYLPFNMSYEEWAPYVDVAEVHNVRSYDDNNDDIIDEIVIEFNKITSGELIPNVPYVVRARNVGTVTFECTNKTVLAAPEHEGYVDCSSTKLTYTFSGIYQTKTDLYDTGAYHLTGGEFRQALTPAATLAPYRFYLTITPRTGGYNPTALPNKVRMAIRGESNATGIDDFEIEANTDGSYYDLLGRKVENPTAGLYIRGGKKVLIK